MTKKLNISVNDVPRQLYNPCSIIELLVLLEQPEKGVAVAINTNIICRSQWRQYQLQENDQVVVFKAIAGG
ncbi:sulfur carrier protein ThiS [Zooshikella marina]|uniref:sulfur carrier protein ThiS n=1 Tax=Zooshikella ganghwensis TaxID=202772 RepID=UPI001BAEAD33|nr:sulfur carrier protein ThiS [Zooshikella ganghwensis]MBU2707577.1 sulfur carrier protein ThiS [Zooshikella ganghwensis]